MNLLYLLFFFFIQGAPQVRGDSTIFWSATRPLTWNDFKGKPQSSGPNGAMTYSGMEFSFENRADSIYFSITTTFNPNVSWVNSKVATDYMLRHEQLHFNITELYSRKLRSALKKMKPGLPNPEVTAKKLYHRFSKECFQVQRLYDKESDHSRNENKQRSWDKKIANELFQLEKDTIPVFQISNK